LAPARSTRLSFAKIPEVQPLPDLLSVQRESFEWFLERGLKQIFEEVSPIEDFTGNLALELTDHRFDQAPESIEEAKDRDSNYSKPLFVTARFLNRETGEIKEQQVFLGDFPMMTDNGTFIINGTERVVVSQLVRSPGVYFDQAVDKTSDKDVFMAKVIPGRGAWLEFDIDRKDTVGVNSTSTARTPSVCASTASGASSSPRSFAPSDSPRATRRSSICSTGPS
jgi:DNA-directed RNA polymerase subunit beta